MRIATLSDASAIHTRRWVEFFRSRGHEVATWSLEKGPADFDVHALPRAPFPDPVRYPLALPALRRAMTRFAPDLIDAHYVPNYGLLGALSGRRPLSVTAWGSDLLVSAGRTAIHAARARLVLRRADLVLADSENLGAAARAHGAAAERVRVVPWGIDLATFIGREPRDPGLLLSTRRHEPVYDLPTVLHGVRPVLEARPDARLVVAGSGRLTPSLERLAAQLLPERRYRFVGRLEPPALAAWLSKAAVYLSASRSDSTSLSLLEAMASGAVPVVSDLEGNREWVSEGDGARLFEPGDAVGLTRAIERVLGDPGWSEGARARNRRVVAERADWNANMRRIESLFEAVALGAPLPGARPPAKAGR